MLNVGDRITTDYLNVPAVVRGMCEISGIQCYRVTIEGRAVGMTIPVTEACKWEQQRTTKFNVLDQEEVKIAARAIWGDCVEDYVKRFGLTRNQVASWFASGGRLSQENFERVGFAVVAYKLKSSPHPSTTGCGCKSDPHPSNDEELWIGQSGRGVFELKDRSEEALQEKIAKFFEQSPNDVRVMKTVRRFKQSVVEQRVVKEIT